MHRRVLSLNGTDWRLGQAELHGDPRQASWEEFIRIEDWLGATVPGNVRADLVRAGLLSDLHFGTQSEAASWVDHHCWWLTRRFELSVARLERVHLAFRGVDYISDLFFNGHHLGQHEGMFSPQIHDISGLLRSENELVVRILGSAWLPTDRSSGWEKLLNVLEARAAGLSERFPHRRDTVKCQMGFGWDFAPPLRTMGIWDDVYAIVSEGVFIRNVAATPRLSGENAVVTINTELDSQIERVVRLRCTLCAETCECDPVAVEQEVGLPPGVSWHTVSLTVSSPHLWWPWDHGRPHLYRLIVAVMDGARLSDSVSLSIGFRHIEFEDWTLRLNSQRVYARGANWVPAKLLPGCVEDADYHSLLQLARRANMNTLRVWGGGLRERRSFYDLCDRLGILLWQEFPFACASLTRYPRTPGYLAVVESEARAIIRDLRNHASVVLWCGGNEFAPGRNQPLIATLSKALAEEDPTRPFLPASPSKGDSHSWLVWHQFHPPSAYRHDDALFVSELGIQAPPMRATLARVMPAEHLWPPGASWSHHGAELRKLRRYARPFLTEDGFTLESFISACQRAQAHGLQIAIEHFRRRKAQGNGGILIWQLNEPWPAISWALLDYYRRAKLAYRVVRRLLSPVLVSLEYPLRRYLSGDTWEADVWVINDGAHSLPGCRAEVVLWDQEGRKAEEHVTRLAIPGDSASTYGRLSWELPPGGGWRLSCQLRQGEETLSKNQYDLAIHDDIRPGAWQRLYAWLTRLVAPA